ncbi:hypothetical protein AVL63_04565 [Nesterenkonia jeotgali]|uniref:Uncharacterized protein n=1 Tax=Nesterenkonia jeotgali TaxID=317018 RepID=A0A0W8ICZ2_9MICC|nr:hypothetical protein [Nesterenkonia jeotgali]KUG57801.1 hypothetical protein AVL63_04565 [Nesterenkonia jeotgali]
MVRGQAVADYGDVWARFTPSHAMGYSFSGGGFDASGTMAQHPLYREFLIDCIVDSPVARGALLRCHLFVGGGWTRVKDQLMPERVERVGELANRDVPIPGQSRVDLALANPQLLGESSLRDPGVLERCPEELTGIDHGIFLSAHSTILRVFVVLIKKAHGCDLLGSDCGYLRRYF